MPAPPGTTPRPWRSAITTARPRQWAKNLLVFAAPATGRVLLEAEVALRVTATFVAFSLLASGIYFVNDVIDRHEDAVHPRKRSRPIAAGLIAPETASVIGVALLVLGSGLALWAGGIDTLAVAVGYVALALAYAFVLRRIALLDMAAIAAGFLLRAVAGAAAADVHLSSWFLIVATFGSLFVAASKRHAEFLRIEQTEDTTARTRSTLAEYSEQYLRFVQYSSSTACITAYCLWAFEGAVIDPLWSGLSIAPFVLGIFRYALLVDGGRGESPEDLLLRDAGLLGFGVAWAACLGMGLLSS
jgi:decaprenyl-phosphate phosphoribosyltransferase